MMVETILESSQDFGMSNGALPQWKRELLQRRAARVRPAAAPPAPPPPPPPPPPAADDDNDEELRYGPGIVKRLKSRYLSLALRDAPRRRPSVLRRATSLEHLLDERPPPAPRAPRAARPVSMAAPAPRPAAARRDFVKRARSVDALSRLDSCEAPAPPSPSPPPMPTPRPAAARTARPPRRPAPLLRDAERPPPDVVRSTLRKFESAPSRRPAPAARVSAVLRGLEGRRSVTPECPEPEPAAPPPAEPAPPPDTPPPATPPPASPQPAPAPAPSPPTSSAPSPPPASPSPTIISPTPEKTPPSLSFPAPVAPTPEKTPTSPSFPTIVSPVPEKIPESKEPTERITNGVRATSPSADANTAGVRPVARAALEGIARAGSSVRFAFEAARSGSHLPPLAATNPVLVARRVGVIRPMPASPRDPPPAPDKRLASPEPAPAPLVNGHSTPEPRVLSRIGAAGIERAWSGSPAPAPAASPQPEPTRAPWQRAGGRGRAPPPAATSIVFNFSNRKEVPDYIENDGIILRASRRNRFKAGEAGVVALRPGALAGSDSEEEPDGGPPSPCAVRFVNDNVLINGRSSMPARPLRDPARIANLKLQFDDSLTRTFEYPSETSLCEDDEPAAPATPATANAHAPATTPAAPLTPATAHEHLADNTHIASAALSRYTPSKMPHAAFQLGVTRHAPPPPAPAPAHPPPHLPHTENWCGDDESAAAAACGAEAASCGAHAVPCGADAARSWSDARSATDLLF